MMKDKGGMVKEEGGTRNLPRRHESKGEDVGRLSMVHGRWSLVRRPWSLVSGLWSMVHGRWSLVRRPWSSISSLRSPVSGPRSPVLGLRSPVSVIVTLLLVAGWALAQPAKAPVFKYYVWGQVRGPGAYDLGVSPDLLELLSAAGGPTQYADVSHVVLIRATTQQRVTINLKTMLLSGQIVSLSPGDMVMVPNSAWYSVREYLSVTTTVVSFATLVFTIMNWVAAR
jgi:hypothetical protein